MGLFQNVVEGLASAAGAKDAVARMEKDKSEQQALSHAELKDQTQSVLDDVAGLQKKRSTLDPKSPTYAKDLEANDKALHDARTTLTDLYHPEKNPNALQHLGGFIRAHIGRQEQAKTPGAIKQDMASRIAGLDAAAAVPGTSTDEYAGLSPEDKQKAIRIKAGLDPRATAPKAEAENWVVTDITKPDGTKVSVQHNTKSGEWSDLAGNPIPKEQLTGATVAPKAAGAGPVRAWKKKNGKMVSVLVDRNTNKEIPGSENESIQPPSNLAGRVTTGFYHYVDDNNQVHQIQETHTSMPAGNGGGGVPRTAGEAKDRILGTKMSPAVTKADDDWRAAVKLASQADEVAKKPGDAVNQKRLAVALERVSAGRFTTQALDYILKAGWGNTIEQWANNPTTGALPKVIMRQLVDGAHQNLTGADKARKAVREPTGNSGAPAAAQSSGKAVSLAKAKQLPAMKGKSDDEIRKAIEASGHTVTP